MQLILVSGLSGSGKTIALRVLEDAGYYCVDNLPGTLLAQVVKLAKTERLAVSVDARSVAVGELPAALARMRKDGIDCRILYLEASDATLLRRFSETRRSHPLASAGRTLSEAIAEERRQLAGVAELGQRIDTSGLQPRALQNWIRELLGIEGGSLTLLFQSFAYRDGIPLDADWVLDCRMLPNPHYQPKLRALTGRDAPVAKFLREDKSAQRWLKDAHALLARWLPEIVRENRSYVTVAIGCTGGRHRSVFLAERLAAAFKPGWRVLVRHRGLAKDEAQ
jgi:UPF0042 nucleotide-binding protein